MRLNLPDSPLIAALLETAVPTIILEPNAPDFTVIHYNKAYENTLYLKKRNITGLSLWEAFNSEKAGGYGPTALLEGFHEATYKKKVVQMKPFEYHIQTEVRNIWETNWWDVKVIPVVYDDIVKYLVLNVYNITHKTLHQDAIEQAIMKELTMAEDLATTNVKLNIALKNLADSHEELTKTKGELEELNKHLQRKVFERTIKLFASDAKHRTLIDNAPVAIAVLKGPSHVIETANKKIIEYWGKTDSVISQPLAEALPELEGQPFIEILNDVRKTGIPYVNKELCAYLYLDGVIQPRYFDMIYQPIEYMEGADSIFIVAVDITDHVNARKKLEESESMFQIAVNAANIGTWSFNTNGNVLSHCPTFANILGWEGVELMTHEQAMAQIIEKDREMMAEVVKQAIEQQREYDLTYTHTRFNDGREILLRLTGKTTFDYSGNQKIFTGIIREITD